MSNLSKIFTQTPVDVQKRSGYDQAHEHIATLPVGSLVPLMCKEVIPNTKFSLGAFAQVQLPPMATDFYGRVDFKLEAFFVPGRLLFGGFEDVLTHDTGETVPPGGVMTSFMPGASGVPVAAALSAGSLADYLGIKLDAGGVGAATVSIPNILPFVGYHLIWQEFYRDSRLQSPILFKRSVGGLALGSTPNAISQLPGLFGYIPDTHPVFAYGTPGSSPIEFVDGVSLFSLRQRAYSKDRFTNATYEPQQGTASVLQVAVSNNVAPITMGGIFSLYTMDQWKRTKNISGRYGEQQLAEFGCYPDSYFCDRPIYLGSTTINIYNKSVYQNTQELGDGISSQNPFRNVGAKYASPMGVGDGSLCDSFTATERGYLYVIGSIVPHAYYDTGSNPMFFRYRMGDFASPILQGVGDEPIYQSELLDNYNYFGNTSNIFGYTQRYSTYKYENDKVSGLLRDGQSLSSFALKRSFNNLATLGSSFIEIPTTALDEVAATNQGTGVSRFGAWADVYFKLKTSMPLSAYTIPTLGRKPDTYTKMVSNGGVRL